MSSEKKKNNFDKIVQKGNLHVKYFFHLYQPLK